MVKQRYELLDTLRGFSLVNMVLYHFIWDLIYIFSVIDNALPNLFYIWQQFICSSFIFISDTAFSFHFPSKYPPPGASDGVLDFSR